MPDPKTEKPLNKIQFKNNQLNKKYFLILTDESQEKRVS
ncbi:hypothetical protein A464_317 [Salmonella bongori N268-08]|uniref:Uncharacterized protein n=1 Tax=Salmonella bongori N268-08 TaxID=1197719 RepID=S5MSE3_SALBN|nr:hypothetical protein A464_317 [Salmonella bongori N268-08]